MFPYNDFHLMLFTQCMVLGTVFSLEAFKLLNFLPALPDILLSHSTTVQLNHRRFLEQLVLTSSSRPVNSPV